MRKDAAAAIGGVDSEQMQRQIPYEVICHCGYQIVPGGVHEKAVQAAFYDTAESKQPNWYCDAV